MIGKALNPYTRDGAPGVIEGTAGQPEYSGHDHSFTLQTIMELQKTTGQLTTAIEALKDSTEKQFESQKELFATKEDLANLSGDIQGKLANLGGDMQGKLANLGGDMQGKLARFEGTSREMIANSEKDLRETIANSEKGLRETIANSERDLRETITNSEKGLRETITNTERDLRQAITSAEKNLHQAITDSITKMDEKRSGHYRWLTTIIAGLSGSALVAGTMLLTNLLNR